MIRPIGIAQRYPRSACRVRRVAQIPAANHTARMHDAPHGLHDRPTPRCSGLRAAVAGLAALLWAAGGCDPKTSDRDLILLDPPGALERLHAGGTLFQKEHVGCWVDPRSAPEYAAGHIAGAINVPLSRMTEEAPVRLAGHNLFVVYGDGFQDPMAKAGAKRLIELGFKDVFVMDGGLRAWQKDGYKVVTGSLPQGGEPEPAKPAAPPGEGAEVPEEQLP
jgi:rhodanese-related sulfurtransferase